MPGADRLPLWAALALPLASLLVAEAIRGRHAPLPAKLAVTAAPLALGAARLAGGGGAVFDAAAAGVVLGGLALAAAWGGAAGAPRRPASGPQRELAAVFLASLAVAAPLGLTDFVDLGLPRLGGLAVLIGLHAASSLAAPGARLGRLALELVGLALPALAAALALAPAGGRAGLFAAAWAASILLALLARVVGRAARRRDPEALGVLASADHSGPGAFWESCRALPLLAEARVIEVRGGDLGPLGEGDVEAIAAALERAHVLSRHAGGLPGAAAHLMGRARADHLVLMRRAPPALLAVPSGLAEPGRAALELRLLARTARLIEAAHGAGREAAP